MTTPKLPEWGAAWIASSKDPLLFATRVLGIQVPGSDPANGPVLEQWQHDFLKTFFIGPDGKPTSDPRHSVRSGHGTGKAQPVTMIIDTPTGPRRFGDLKTGDLVFGANGTPTRVTGVFPQGVKPVLKVSFGDGTSTRACADHLWAVRGRQERRNGTNAFKVMSTQQIVEAGVKRANGSTNGTARTAAQWEIPVCGPVEYAYRWTPVDPYTFGSWLGDGTRLTNCITTQDEQTIDAIREAGYVVTRRSKGALTAELTPYWCVHGMAEGLRLSGVFDLGSSERFVPDVYKYNIAEVRAEVLRGLMDSDGWISATGSPIFNSSSRRLVDDVAWLVRSLGGIARVTAAKNSYRVTPAGERISGLPSWGVSMCLPSGFKLFKLDRKQSRMRDATRKRYLARWIESIEPDGEEDCVCIKVDAADSLYVANDFIVTHNTTLIAILALWFVLTHYDCKCVITAASQDQLRDGAWSEVRKWAACLPAELRDQLDIGEERLSIKAAPEMGFVVRRTASKSNPEALQGIHATHVLYLIDESSGIEDVVFEVAAGSLSTKGAMACLFSNPTRSSGFFFDTHHKLRHRWRTHVVSSEDVPRARGHIEDIVAAYGKGSNRFRVRVLGEFPTADDDTIISLELVEAARKREVVKRDVRPVWGVDVGRFGDDSSALAKRQGNVLLEPVKEWQGKNTMQLVGLIVEEWQKTDEDMRPVAIMVDVIGIGSGVVDRLEELGLPVQGINVAENASVDDKYSRQRDELWWKGRQWFEARDCHIPADEKLIGELTSVTYDFASSGKLVAESKREMRKRGLPSPNKADAFLLTFASPDIQRKKLTRWKPAARGSSWAA